MFQQKQVLSEYSARHALPGLTRTLPFLQEMLNPFDGAPAPAFDFDRVFSPSEAEDAVDGSPRPHPDFSLDPHTVFKLFSMAKSTKSMNRSGTGIGLYQSQKNAELLGFPNGDGITVRSEWQKGSTFSFIL